MRLASVIVTREQSLEEATRRDSMLEEIKCNASTLNTLPSLLVIADPDSRCDYNCSNNNNYL